MRKENEREKKLQMGKLLLNTGVFVFLVIFQLALYLALVPPNRNNNLLAIKHIVVLNKFEDVPNLTLRSNAVNTYQTDSVEVVEGHFNFRDFNIEMQLLLLLIAEIICFVIFYIMKISPAPFVVPLFMILTVSLFYHNYVGHRVTDNLSIPSITSVACLDNCDNSKDVGIIKCDQTYWDDPKKYECQGIPENYVKKIPCEDKGNEIKCNDVSILENPETIQKDDEKKYILEENGRKIIKIVKIDKEKMKKGAEINKALKLGIYAKRTPSVTLWGKLIEYIRKKLTGESEQYIKFESEDPNINDSNISDKEITDNKYIRASHDSKEHSVNLFLGLIYLLVSMLFAKYLSTKNFTDFKFFIVIGSLIGVGFAFVGLEKFLDKGSGVTSLGEYAKLASIVLTVIGYEKINKNIVNLVSYILALSLGIGALFLLKDYGNMIILGVIVSLVLLIALPCKKRWSITLVVLIYVLLFVGSVWYEQDYNRDLQWRISKSWLAQKWPGGNIPWRLKDTWDSVKAPLYKCEIPEKPKTDQDEAIPNFKHPFYSTKSNHQICYKKDDKKNIIGLDVVINCTKIKDGKQECELDTGCDIKDKKLECDSNTGFVNYSKDSYYVYDDNGDISGIKPIQYDETDCNKIACKQINKDSRLAIFAVLKDGFLGGGGSKDKLFGRPAGFKGNTFLLHNHYMYTDFVFDGLIAFFGLFLTGVVFLSLLVLIWNCKIRPGQCGNNYKHFLYSNILVTILATQALIHIGGDLNIIPFTGVILPFLSRAMIGTPVLFITLGFALGGLISDEFMESLENMWKDLKDFCGSKFRRLTAKNSKK